MTRRGELALGDLARRRGFDRLYRRAAQLRAILEREEREIAALTEGEADEFLSQHPADLGAALEMTEEAVLDREHARRELRQVESALRRIEDGRYGVCEDCGARIAPERLEVLPYTPRCVGCARDAERLRKLRVLTRV